MAFKVTQNYVIIRSSHKIYDVSFMDLIVLDFYEVHAAVAALIFKSGICDKVLPAASNVAPVVKTSSISNRCLPIYFSPFLISKISFTLSQRSSRDFFVCVDVNTFLTRQSLAIGIFVFSSMPWDMT